MKKLSKRGNLVAGIAIGLWIAVLYYLAGHFWYVEGKGICLDTMANCYEETFTR